MTEYIDNEYLKFIKTVENKTYYVKDIVNKRNYFITARQLAYENYFGKKYIEGDPEN